MAAKEAIVKELQKSYWMEIETVMNYMAHTANMDGILAEEVREVLSEEIQEEVGHAETLANRIRELDGTVEGSKNFKATQDSAQPPSDSTDIKSVIKGVIDAEKGAIEQYQKIIELTDGEDFVTQDLCIELKADEEKHLRLFKGFLKDIG